MCKLSKAILSCLLFPLFFVQSDPILSQENDSKSPSVGQSVNHIKHLKADIPRNSDKSPSPYHVFHSASEQLHVNYKITGVSGQNLLQTTYFDNKTIHKSNEKSPVDTLKILAIRVSFQKDTLEKTTGDGTFMLTHSDTTIIDPPPHDREYFLAQISGASHYYRSVSNAKLILTGDVYPLESENSYTLPHTMAYYNPNTSEDELNLRLSELLKDAITTANQEEQIPFSQFDIFVIFHAGVGQDVQDEFDTTPNDIPSAFLNKAHMTKYLGNDNPNYQGIQTSDGYVTEGIILPETQNQEGNELALKGTFVMYLGNQLGLPSLFNTENDQAGIGAWGLMDQGSNNYFGLIPAQPCAWSKIFLGWEKAIELEPGTDIRIAIAKSQSANHIYKIPINGREYFLLENRNHDYNNDEITTGRDQFGHRLEFKPRGNFTAQIDTAAGERLGVITKVFDYDFNIPGSGILIWHIDDRVIEKNYKSNTVNNDSEHQGVDLEEADGSQDIGQSYGFLDPGSGSELGVAEDAYYKDNDIHKTANKSDHVRFSSYSSPSSHSNSGANTGILIKNFSLSDSVMMFDYMNTTTFGHFPQRFAGETTIAFPPVVTTLENDQNKAIFFTSGNGHLFAWHADGTPLLPGDHQLTITNWDGEIDSFQVALFDTVQGNFTSPPTIGDINNDGVSEIIAGVDYERILIWAPRIDNTRGFAKRIGGFSVPVKHILLKDSFFVITGEKNVRSMNPDGSTQWEVAFSDSIVDLCLTKNTAGQQYIAAVSSNGDVKTIDQSGQVIAETSLSINTAQEIPFSISSGSLHDQNGFALVILSEKQVFAFSPKLEMIADFPIQLKNPILSRPIVADMDQDGRGEIILSTQNEIAAFNHNGVHCNGFSVPLPHPFEEKDFQPGSPVFLTRNNQGIIFTKDGTNDLFAVRSDGGLLNQYHLNGGGRLPSPFLSIADLNQDGSIELIETDSDGTLNVRQLDISNWQTQGSWLQTYFDEGGTKFNPESLEADEPSSNILLDYAYNYPNPTEGDQTKFRFFLNQDAQIAIEIYDLSGEQIDKLHASGTVRENEIVWSVDNIASGVYMARLEANNGHQKDVKIIKVAVVK